VYCPLPEIVVKTMAALANPNERYFVYDGKSQPFCRLAASPVRPR